MLLCFFLQKSLADLQSQHLEATVKGQSVGQPGLHGELPERKDEQTQMRVTRVLAV